MNVRETLIEYLRKHYTAEQAVAVLKSNDLYYKLGEAFVPFGPAEAAHAQMTKLHLLRIQQAAAVSLRALDDAGVRYVVFKGMVLSKRLYGTVLGRTVGDVDVFPLPRDWERAFAVLTAQGYVPSGDGGVNDPHHVVLSNGRVTIELHRHIFAPQVGLDETYLQEHTEVLPSICDNTHTFDVTATLLHLLYHLYMDVFCAASLYPIVEEERLPVTRRFLYRAYELALYAEMYEKDIRWQEVCADVRAQRLYTSFGKTVEGITAVFPDAFPDMFTETVNALSYTEGENEAAYRRFCECYNADEPNALKAALCRLMEADWSEKNAAVVYDAPDIFRFPPDSSAVRCAHRLTEEGLKLVFDVQDNDLYMSAADVYDTLCSDGVHLLLWGVFGSYHSIFLFPKQERSALILVPYDVRSGAPIACGEVYGACRMTEEGYCIEATLGAAFLKKHRMEEGAYMGVIVSDCDRDTGKRCRAIMTAPDDSRWCDPLCFVRVI